MLKIRPVLLLFLLCSACTQEQDEGFFSKLSTNFGLVCPEDEVKSADFRIKAIYGEDNRLDWFESPGKTKDYWAKATLALMPSSKLVSNGVGGYSIMASSYKNAVNLCDGQPFEYQPSAAFCSGFLVSEDLVVTAGHCVRDIDDCLDTEFVFDYAKTDSSQEDFHIPHSSVYHCADVVEAKTGSQDFAVIRLDRPVTDRTPLNVRRSGSLSRGDQVMLIGHPMGLPSKIADGGFVQRVGSKIEASVDAFAANSGSVILNSVTGFAEGILVAGEVDFNYLDGCRVEARCGSNCDGEVITPIKDVLSFIPNVVYDNPICQENLSSPENSP